MGCTSALSQLHQIGGMGITWDVHGCNVTIPHNIASHLSSHSALEWWAKQPRFLTTFAL